MAKEFFLIIGNKIGVNGDSVIRRSIALNKCFTVPIYKAPLQSGPKSTVNLKAFRVHHDHDNCLEVLVVRGKAKEIKAMADKLITSKGVKHGKLVVTTAGKDLT